MRYIIQSDRGGPKNRWGSRVTTMSGRFVAWFQHRRDAIAYCEAHP